LGLLCTGVDMVMDLTAHTRREFVDCVDTNFSIGFGRKAGRYHVSSMNGDRNSLVA
jgi:hypothetical protein